MQSGTTGTAAGAEAWLALALVPGLAPRRALTLAGEHGGADALLGRSPAALAGLGLSAAAVRAWPGARDRARAELEALSRAGARLVTWGDPHYPARLRTIAEPPLALAVRGALELDEAPAVAIVGARRASGYGRRVAEDLAWALARVGVTVVSGLAAGIDAAAHRGALRAGGRTVAVLGTGIDRVYPSWHAPLAREVAAQGALVSEFPCGAPPRKEHFPRRNRIVAGLALGTVVVQATLRSGSLGTARHALEAGREVFAVPGPLGDPLHEGPHALIRDGAWLVRGAEDVLDAIAPQLRPGLAAARVEAAAAALHPDEARLLNVLEEARHVDDVIRAVGGAPATTLETLLALELRGLVVQEPGMRFRRSTAA